MKNISPVIKHQLGSVKEMNDIIRAELKYIKFKLKTVGELDESFIPSIVTYIQEMASRARVLKDIWEVERKNDID